MLRKTAAAVAVVISIVWALCVTTLLVLCVYVAVHFIGKHW